MMCPRSNHHFSVLWRAVSWDIIEVNCQRSFQDFNGFPLRSVKVWGRLPARLGQLLVDAKVRAHGDFKEKFAAGRTWQDIDNNGTVESAIRLVSVIQVAMKSKLRTC